MRGEHNFMKKAALHNYLFMCMAVFCLLFTACGKADYTNLAGTGEPPASVTETPQNEGTSKPEVITTESPSENGKEIISIEEIPAYSGSRMWKLMETSRTFQRRIKQKNPLSSTVSWIRWEDAAWPMQMWEKT